LRDWWCSFAAFFTADQALDALDFVEGLWDGVVESMERRGVEVVEAAGVLEAELDG
jgi:hypothetical protein